MGCYGFCPRALFGAALFCGIEDFSLMFCRCSWFLVSGTLLLCARALLYFEDPRLWHTSQSSRDMPDNEKLMLCWKQWLIEAQARRNLRLIVLAEIVRERHRGTYADRLRQAGAQSLRIAGGVRKQGQAQRRSQRQTQRQLN